jgi:hypothetical protein
VPDRRKQGAEEEQLQQQEEQLEAERRQDQQRDAAQDAVGNQGIAAMLGLSNVRPGEAGLAAGAQQSPDQQQELQHGGDDPPEDGPLTLDDLVRSWNPTTRRGQDAPPGALGALDGLPGEDEALLDAVRHDRSPLDLPPAQGPDPMLQPSEDVVVRDLRPAVRQAARWASGSVVHRAWLGAISPPARALVDPEGRLVHTRARAAALATLLLVDGVSSGAPVSPLVGFTLELAARAAWIDRSLALVREQQARLPQAVDLLGALVGGAEGEPEGPTPRPLAAAAAEQLAAALTDLLDLPSASVLLPSLASVSAEPEAADDDPLGIDDLLASALGPADPLAGVYDAALQGAERLAGGAARLRVHGAGLLAAVGEVCDQWSAGAPRGALAAVADALDREVAEVLQLLVEVGRAIQRRAVAPEGIRNGLRRVARGLDAAAARLVARVIPVVGGVLPEAGEVRPPPPPADDPLSEAWAEGVPGEAVGWLGSLPAGLERDAAVLLTRAAAGEVEALVSALWVTAGRAAAEGRPALSGALGIAAGAAMLRGGACDAALTVAEAQLAAAEQRRNGVWIASAALLAIEAHRGLGDAARADAVRYRAARVCWQVGGRAGLSLLLRWRLPETDMDPARV